MLLPFKVRYGKSVRAFANNAQEAKQLVCPSNHSYEYIETEMENSITYADLFQILSSFTDEQIHSPIRIRSENGEYSLINFSVDRDGSIFLEIWR